MLIMSYSGIRGAVAFALALILDESKIPRKKEFVTATIAVVFFIQGTTIGPIVNYFKIKKKEEKSCAAVLANRLIDNTMSCLEEIADTHGKYTVLEKIRTYDKKYVMPLLSRPKLVAKDERLFKSLKNITYANFPKISDSQALFSSQLLVPPNANMPSVVEPE
jgi:sodium/hydrogen exchanger-like protein 3